MSTRRTSMVLACAALLSQAPAHARYGCDPRILDSAITFPTESERRAQSGTVVLELLIGADGRVTAADLAEASGYRLLDRAAQTAALQQWRFDVSQCERKDLPMKQRIAVEYRSGSGR